MILASIGSNRPPTSSPSTTPASTRTPSPAGQRSRTTSPVAGRKPCLRVLGVEPDLDRVAAPTRRPPGENPSGSPAAIRELVGDEVAAGHELGHRVLDLEAGVHLEERERAAIVEQELAGAGADVADGSERGRAPPRPSARAARRRRPASRASSSTFWWRRWSEQSRSPRWTPSPWRSNRTWISTCRAPSTRRSRISRSSPNARRGLAAGGRQARSAVARGSRTVRIPLPPPPAAA